MPNTPTAVFALGLIILGLLCAMYEESPRRALAECNAACGNAVTEFTYNSGEMVCVCTRVYEGDPD